jgi:hypothetical protein
VAIRGTLETPPRGKKTFPSPMVKSAMTKKARN